MLVSIIPLSRSLGTEPLLYRATDTDIVVGALVEIPYGDRIDDGIVAALYSDAVIDTSDSTIKSIISMKANVPLLSEHDVSLIEALAKRYMLAIHRVLRIFLPQPILKRLEKQEYPYHPSGKKTDTPKRELIVCQDGIVTPSMIARELQTQTVVILPDDYSIAWYQHEWREQQDIYWIPHQSTETKRAQSWIDIWQGKYPIIVGTRRLLYYNLSHYNHIIYVEDALGGDYWHYPIRMQYIDILRLFAEVHTNTSIQIITSIPLLSTLSQYRSFQMRSISIGSNN